MCVLDYKRDNIEFYSLLEENNLKNEQSLRGKKSSVK